MTENFLHFIWQYRLHSGLYDHYTGEPVTVIDPGRINTDSGPDFFNSRIRIGDTTWAGNIEIHIHSSDWIRHKHHQDPAYDSVILHVVHKHDTTVRRNNGLIIPCVELNEHYDPLHLEKYAFLSKNRSWIPCSKLLYQAETIAVSSWLETLFVARMEHKVADFSSLLSRFGNDWDRAMLVLVARCFGMKSNILPFEMLVASFPFTLLSRIRGDIARTEALLFGQAGMLGSSKDEYQERLKKEHEFISCKNSLEPINSSLWKFMRLRPGQFPTVRIAELAALLHKTERVFSSAVEAETAEELSAIFSATASSYWETHYKFGKVSPPQVKSVSDDMKLLIMVNAVIPALFAYGKIRNEPAIIAKALEWACSLPPEKNSILENFRFSGLNAVNVMQSQALLELKKSYCNAKRCLECRIGYHIIRNPHRVL